MSLPSPDCLPPTSVESIAWLVDHTGLKEDPAQTVLTKFRGSRICALCSFVQGRTSIPFSFIKDKVPKVAVSVTNDIVFEAYCRVHQLVKQSGSPEAVCWTQLADSNWDVNAALKILNPTSAAASGETVAVSGPLLNSDFFVKEEILTRAPLFGLHTGDWLQRNREALIARTKKWTQQSGDFYAGASLEIVPLTEKDKLQNVPRIIWMDCVRTFFNDGHRQRLANFLHSLWKESGTYGQAMSYVAGVLLLTLEEQDVATIMRKIDKEYIKGHWAAEAIGFATNAYVWDFLLAEIDKELHTHFKTIGFLPDTYLQKIFSGLSIHVLDFDLMYDFLERFLQEGFPWLLRFATATALHNKARILKCGASDVATLYSIMRFDGGAGNRDDALQLFKIATALDMKPYLPKIDDWRMRSYDEVIEPRLKKAPKEETFEPCALCDKARPSLMCDDFGAICKGCYEKKTKEGFIFHNVEDW